jgi:hypothetical protein
VRADLLAAYVRRKRWEHRALANALVLALAEAFGWRKKTERVPPGALLRQMGALVEDPPGTETE